MWFRSVLVIGSTCASSRRFRISLCTLCQSLGSVIFSQSGMILLALFPGEYLRVKGRYKRLTAVGYGLLCSDHSVLPSFGCEYPRISDPLL